MQTFKLFMKLVVRYRFNIILYFSIFLATVIILSKVNGGNSEASYTQTKLDIGIVDLECGSFSDTLKDCFGSEHNLIEIENEENSIAEGLYWRVYDYVLVIPSDMMERIENGETEGLLESMQVPGSFSASYFETELNMFLNKYLALKNCGYSEDEISEMLEKLVSEKTKVEMVSETNEKKDEPVTKLFLYAAYGFISICVSAIAIVLLNINEENVKRRIECSSDPLKNRIAGITAGIITFGIVLLLAMLIIAGIMTKGNIYSDLRLPYFIGNMAALLVFSLSLAYLSGMAAKKKETINGIVNIASLGLCFLGGVFVPQEFFGKGIETLAKCMPTYWYVKNHNMISSMVSADHEFLMNFWSYLAIVFMFGIAIFAGTNVYASVKRKEK